MNSETTIRLPKILLIGTPNSGKTSLFNRMTGLNHRTANFPGVTTHVQKGRLKLKGLNNSLMEVECYDLPGIYSLNPETEDEKVAVNCIRKALDQDGPQCVIFVADPTTPFRTLHLLEHLRHLIHIDLVVFNFWDVAQKEGIVFSEKAFRDFFGEDIRYALHNPKSVIHIRQIKSYIAEVLALNKNRPPAHPLLALDHCLNPQERIEQSKRVYEKVVGIVPLIFKRTSSPLSTGRMRLVDRILLHPVLGFGIFLIILFFIFQAIFLWSAWPMNFIEQVFAGLGDLLHQRWPDSLLVQLLADGVLQGLAGVLMFVPQIAFLLFFMALMEETGYMARVVAIMDRFMRVFGLSGRSVVPLLGGAACAVPSILATRSIPNSAQRLITILVIPLMSCSARIPVYSLLLGLLLPPHKWFGIDVRGLALLVMYLVGFSLAIGAAWMFSKFKKIKGHDFLLISLPHLQVPLPLVLISKMWVSLKEFIFGAGKIIFFLSVILWAMLNYGPADLGLNVKSTNSLHSSGQHINPDKIQNSWAALFGKLIEPVIKPMGCDWRLGVAIISSFAAREVFSGTVATLFPPPGKVSLRDHLLTIRNVDGTLLFSPATCMALLVFYAIALQCVSTIVTIFHESKSVFWPLLQFSIYMLMAWVLAVVVYQLF